jgi:hypothetical protein
MGGVNFNTSANFQVPGGQQGGATSQENLANMSAEKLAEVWSNSSGAQKEAAWAELQKRLAELMSEKGGEKGGEKGAPEKGGGGGEKGVPGGEKGGSGGSLDELLKRILEKLKAKEPLNAEEQALADQMGLKTSEKGNTPPDQGGNPDSIPSATVPPGNV